jgi:nucleoside-diphosphate-sugar epimerase
MVCEICLIICGMNGSVHIGRGPLDGGANVTVVVTGSGGFIGRHLVNALIGSGTTVVGIDRRSPSGTVPLAVDLLDLDSVAEDALRQADAVFHLAGLPGVRETGPDVETRRIRDNVLATKRVLELVPPGTPLVVTSSSSIYGGSADGRPCREDDAPRPRGGYAESKLEMERLCAGRLADGGAVTVCRLFTVAGPGQRPDMALASWIRAVLTGSPVPIFGSPERSRDLLDVRDAVTALRALAERDARETVNIGTGVGHTLREMVTAIGRALGAEPETDITPAALVDPAATLADVSRLRRLTGLRPRTDLNDLVERQVAEVAVDGTPLG